MTSRCQGLFVSVPIWQKALGTRLTYIVNSGLQNKTRVSMINDKIKDNTSMNGVLYLFHHFSPFPCEVTYSNKRFLRFRLKCFYPKRFFMLSWYDRCYKNKLTIYWREFLHFELPNSCQFLKLCDHLGPIWSLCRQFLAWAHDKEARNE